MSSLPKLALKGVWDGSCDDQGVGASDLASRLTGNTHNGVSIPPRCGSMCVGRALPTLKEFSTAEIDPAHNMRSLEGMHARTDAQGPPSRHTHKQTHRRVKRNLDSIPTRL